MMNEYPVNYQIAVYKTNKKLAEFNDKLKPTLLENYAHIHARGDKLPDGRKLRSCIGVVLQDYSKGAGQQTVRVSANLAPEFFPYALSRAAMGVETFDFQEDKIFGVPDTNGRCQVTKVTIKRASVGSDGKPRRYPWYICIENGRAVKEPTQTGGIHMKAGSYTAEKKVFININDFDFYGLLHSVNRFIEIWELTNGPRLIRDATKLMEAYYMQHPSGGRG